NQLNSLLKEEENTRREITRLAEKVGERLNSIEEQIEALKEWREYSDWLDFEIHACDHFPPHFRLLHAVKSFYFKFGDCDIQKLKYLRKAIKEIGLPWKDPIKISSFMDGLIDEIYQNEQIQNEMGSLRFDGVKADFVLDNISVSSYASLYLILDYYKDTLKLAGEKFEEALRSRIRYSNYGIDLEVSMSWRDLAVELLYCMSLTKRLYEQQQRMLEGKIENESAVTHIEAVQIPYYQKSHQKSPEELYVEASQYYTGNGKSQDLNKALILYHQAAEQGHIKAQYKLGEMYYDIKEIDKHYEKAFKWYSKAAEQGHSDAQYKLGRMYHTGEGTKQSYLEAVKWYEKAANQKHIPALKILGDMHGKGEWLEKDRKKMFEFYKQAADLGDEIAQCFVAYCYFCGDGAEQNFTKAEEYLLKCVSGKKMTKEEIIK
ncbi:MAG: sel1 repeat family protein, partial [Nitrospirae bacterium]|nr:sel1 repeat family protein [Nitrospirota bacterium]